MQYKLIALFGKQGSGKDTIKQWMTSHIPNTKNIISYTTRPKREYEIEGQDYYFVPHDEFTHMEFIVQNEYNNWFYGTSWTSLEKNSINIGVFSISDIELMIKKYKIQLQILPIYIQASDKELLIRSIKREKKPNYKEICRRFLADEEDFSNIPFDYEVFNNNAYYDGFFGIQYIPRVAAFLQF